MTSLNKIKIFLVDDHPIVRSGLKTELKKYENMELIGEAASGKEAVEKINSISPDIILMDISMPDMNGLVATEQILKKNRNAKIIILSMHDNQNYVLEVIRLGAMGYVMKDADPQELIKAIETVNDNKPYYSSKISETILKQHAAIIRKSKKSFTQERLTDREVEVLKLIAEGCTNKEIAKKLEISSRTVEAHRENIMGKLGIKSIAGLTKYALQNNLA
jgi:DNA-binding NarL/FixJ family response regulator